LGRDQKGQIGDDKILLLSSSELRTGDRAHKAISSVEDELLDRSQPSVVLRRSAARAVPQGPTERVGTLPIGPVDRTEDVGPDDGDRVARWGSDGDGPTSWRLERNLRQVTFAECRELSVFSETTSARVSAPHAHPAWTLLLPVDGGSVTIVAGDVVRVRSEGVLLAPQSQYQAATDGPHVAVYANAWRWARPDSMRPLVIGALSARRVLDALDVDSGTDLSAAIAELAPLVGRVGPTDSRLAYVIEGLPAARRLDVLAGEVGIS